ncbi:methylenetetrahydrofolate reduct [Hanseniaspora valbyensis NRRL Y-1626]|uniref:Methylenetetrahydrofolate reduct n=1 Tax=Hanseniaspora valbyensis NRRL Y-1626 TaxID=766949 RepID=A0A1B7TG70_9ASCO|nr:methylenetetrahydrofolate reduct [Hanseniaspora valbyensis NRRL Y-1626]
MKVDEKIENYQKDNSYEIPSFSYEYFVPKTLQGSYNLYERIDKMNMDSNPLFIDVTWNAGGVISPNIPIPKTNDIIETSQQALQLDSCMHMTCTNMTMKEIDSALKKAYESGCENILALRGDPPRSVEQNGKENVDASVDKYPFKYAKDLVRYIKEKYGDHFCIGVAAYPEGHPEEANSDVLIKYLKEKVDLGATFIITQMFYNTDIFIAWCEKVRAAGIPENVHIIPGIMPITSYDSFLRRCNWCQINVPQDLNEVLKPVQQDDEALRNLATNYVAKMCLKLFKSGHVKHLHFYTMNLEKGSYVILKELERLLGKRLLPLAAGLNSNANKEKEMKPIFWKSRPFSYVERKKKSKILKARTKSTGNEFPNGRFGDSSSPAFGNLDLSLTQLIRQAESKSLSVWGTPTSIKELGDLIIGYLKGDLRSLPWCDTPVALEAKQLLRLLISINQGGILTVNSQPKANGVPSSDQVLGWGPSMGYVYQKQYIEFLLPKRKLKQFFELVDQKNSSTFTFMISDADDEVFIYKGDDAVTWGCFPGREIVTTTIVEKNSFLMWRDELFAIIKEWKNNFDTITENAAKSVEVMTEILDDYLLVSLIDNDYVNPGDLLLFTLLQLTD